MQKISAFLWFNNQAEEAADFYISIFKNSKIINKIPNGDSVLGVTFQLDGQEFMALNGGPQYTFTPAISLFVNCKTQEEVDDYWNKLLAGGRAEQCGWLTDKYGLSWQIVPTILGEMLQDKDQKKSQRVMEAMLKMIKLDIKTLEQAYNNEPAQEVAL